MKNIGGGWIFDNDSLSRLCDDLQLVQKREKRAKSSSEKTKLWKNVHERNAKRVYNAIVGLEGLWVKAGQYLSTRADVLPDPYIQVLRQLQDSLPPRPIKEVRKGKLCHCQVMKRLLKIKYPIILNLLNCYQLISCHQFLCSCQLLHLCSQFFPCM